MIEEGFAESERAGLSNYRLVEVEERCRSNGLPAFRVRLRYGTPAAAGSVAVTTPSIGAVRGINRPSVQNGSSRRVLTRALVRRYWVLSEASTTCASWAFRVYSEDYSAYAGCASARPPGADTRRPPPPPPLAGVVPFLRTFRCPDKWGTPAKLRNRDFGVGLGTRSIHSSRPMHRLGRCPGTTSAGPRTVG